MRRIHAIAVISVLLAGACGTGSALGEEVRLVRGALEQADQRGRTFVYRDVTDDQRVEVRGRETDDLRYRGIVSIDGREAFEAIISDDAFALRLSDPAGSGAPVVAAAMAEDDVVGTALNEGRWVIDYTAAPPVVRERQEGEVQVGANPFLDVFYLFQYLERALQAGAGMERFNPEDIDYNPEDDPWSDDAERDLEDRGVRRYDLGLPALPSRSQRGTQQTLPSTNHFRKMAVYLKGETAVLVREQIDIADRREFRRAEQGRAAAFYEELRDAALAGFTQEPIRERRMSYEIEDFDSDLTISLPEDSAEIGSLSRAIGPQGLGTLFEPPPEAGAPAAPGALPGDLPDGAGGEGGETDPGQGAGGGS